MCACFRVKSRDFDSVENCNVSHGKSASVDQITDQEVLLVYIGFNLGVVFVLSCNLSGLIK